MCVLVDINCLPQFFDINHGDHADFAPLNKWVFGKDGFLVYGGKKYKSELKRCRRYLKIILELQRSGRVCELPENLVDCEERRITKIHSSASANDQHLVAIAIVAKLRVVCTLDGGAKQLLRMRVLYPKSVRRPSIYCRKRHSNLLKPVNLKPCACL